MKELGELEILGERFQRQASLARYVGYRTGGSADFLVFPETEEELIMCVSAAESADMAVTVIAGGSNLLVRDGGVRGLVIRMGGDFAKFEISGDTVRSGCAVSLPALSRKTAVNGLSGLEFGVGVPGTVGGALYMNAGAAGQEIGQVTRRVRYLQDGRMIHREIQPQDFSYRKSWFQQQDNLILMQAEFLLTPGDVQQLRQKQEELIQTRRATQPQKVLSAGCVFRNPEGQSAGRLIDQCGLKGLRRGDAVVSDVHANFLVNAGRASAEDIEQLMEAVEAEVFHQTGIRLVREVCVLGERA